MTNTNAKEIVKRFFHSVENSYNSANYMSKLESSSKKFYAILNILNDNQEDDSTGDCPFIGVSEYLLKQYELSKYSKVQVKTLSFSTYVSKECQKIVIRTAYKNVSL